MNAIKHFIATYDVLGTVLFAAGSGLMLLSFSLVKPTPENWRAPHILGVAAGGFASLVFCALVEKWVAHRDGKPFIPLEDLRHRNTRGACGMAFFCGVE